MSSNVNDGNKGKHAPVTPAAVFRGPHRTNFVGSPAVAVIILTTDPVSQPTPQAKSISSAIEETTDDLEQQVLNEMDALPAVADAAEAKNKVSEGFRKVREGFAEVGAGVQESMDKIVSGTKTLGQKLADIMRSISQAIAAFFKTLWQRIKDGLRAIGNAIANFFKSLANFFVGR